MKPTSPIKRLPQPRGFTLIEILVVIGLIAVLLVAAVPTFGPVFQSSKITQAGDQLRNHFTTAQQTALNLNVPVEVHFYKFKSQDQPGSDEWVTAYQIFSVHPGDDPKADPTKRDSFKYVPVGTLNRMPPGTLVSTDPELTTLFEDAFEENYQDVIKGLESDTEKSYPFYYVTFRANGSLARDSDKHWYLTVIDAQTYKAGKEKTPDNYVCLAIDDTGRVKSYVPGIK